MHPQPERTVPSDHGELEDTWQAPPGYARPVFLGVTALYWMSLYFYVPTLSPYVEHQGGTLRMVGLVVSAYGLAQLLLRIPLGMLSDRLGRRRPFLVLGFAANVMACLLFVVVTAPWLMVGARLMSGIAACAWVAFSVLFASYFPPGQSARAMSYITFCNSLSVMMATYTGGWLADQYGWLAPFWLSAGVGIVGLVALPLVHEKPMVRGRPKPFVRRLHSLVQYPELVFAAVVAALGQYTTFATHFGFLPNYAVHIGATKTQLGVLTMLGMVSISSMTLLSGTLFAPRLGARFTVLMGYVLVAASTAVIPFITSMDSLYVVQIAGGLGRGVAYPILMGLAISRLPDAEKASAMGFFQAVYAIGMFTGPVVAGLIGEQWGYGVLFLSTSAVALVTAGVAIRLPGKEEGKAGN